MKSTELALALKCSPVELNCETAFELLYKVPTRFKSIVGYRELILNQENEKTAKILMESPIILLHPIQKINEHHFTYSITQLKRNPKAKMNYKKAFKEKNDLTTSQGRPIFNSY
jgi:hypothetical protein